jgi:hypothetical protein
LPLWERTMPSPRSSGWWPISTWPT